MHTYGNLAVQRNTNDNNLHELIKSLLNSGKSKEQIFNTLYFMSVPKEFINKAFQDMGIEENQNKSKEMSTDLRKKIPYTNYLLQMENEISKREDDLLVGEVTKIVRKYDESHGKLSTYDYLNGARSAVRELQKYDHIDEVNDCIHKINDDIVNNFASIKIEEAYQEMISNGKYNGNLFNKVNELRNQDENLVREEVYNHFGNYKLEPKIQEIYKDVLNTYKSHDDVKNYDLKNVNKILEKVEKSENLNDVDKKWVETIKENDSYSNYDKAMVFLGHFGDSKYDDLKNTIKNINKNIQEKRKLVESNSEVDKLPKFKQDVYSKLKGIVTELNELKSNSITDREVNGAIQVIRENINNITTFSDKSIHKILNEVANSVNRIGLKKANSILEEIRDVWQNNRNNILVENTINELQKSNSNNFYHKVIEDLNKLVGSDEEDIKYAFKYNLDKYNWVNHVYSLTEMFKKEDNEVISETVNQRPRYSPVFESDKGWLFYLDGKYLNITENGDISEFTVDTIRSKKPKLIEMAKIIDNFHVNQNGIKAYFENGTVHIFNNNDGDKKITINDRSLKVNEAEVDIKNALYKSGIIRLDDPKAYYVTEAYENFENFVELDFVKSISTNESNNIHNLILTGKGLFHQKANAHKNILEEVDDADNLVENIKNEINYDVSDLVIDYVNEAKQLKKLKKEKLDNINEKLEFVKDQKKKIQESVTQPDGKVLAIEQILDEEIQSLTNEYNEIIENS